MRLKDTAFLLSMMISAPAWANAASTTEDCRKKPAKPVPAEIMTDGFFEAHPDLRWRSVGLGEYREGKYPEALNSFKHASSYADKFSQSMVAHMYWNGLGTEIDRALAYVWMDLAAERMYHDFLQQRELYWAMLDERQRADAVVRGQPIFEQYADRLAKPRMEEQLRKVRTAITGSRTGFVGVGLYVKPMTGPAAGEEIPGAIMYAPEYWEPQQYWCTQDSYWSKPQGGNVEVGSPVQVQEVGKPND